MAKNRAHSLLLGLDDALQRGEIDEQTWYREVASVITPAYLRADTPRAQSGHSGDDVHWERARSLIVDAVDHDGTFLDVGCASGYLMECVQRWARDRGYQIAPYGLDIAPELAELARTRLPQWRDRIWVGNARTWVPPMRFDYVRTGLEYVPRQHQRDLIQHLLENVVAPGGCLVIGTVNEETAHTTPWQEEIVVDWGFEIAGHSERPHYLGERLLYRVFWIDKA